MHILVNLTTFKLSSAEGLSALKPLHDGRPRGAVIESFCQPTSLSEQYKVQFGANPLQYRYISDNAYIRNDADVPEALEQAFTSLPTRQSFTLYFSMNPTSRRSLGDMALSMQTDHYFSMYAIWNDEAEDEKCAAWVRDTMREVERSESGSYLGDADFRARRTMFWGEAEGKRLMDVRRKWDPEGRICGFLDERDASGVDGLRNEFELE
jgi:hypothetical protein